MKAFKVPAIFSAIDKISEPVKKMGAAVSAFVKRSEEDIARFERKYRKMGETSKNVAKKSFVVGAALLAPLAVAGNNAIQFEDRMADVQKTTGLAGKELDKFGRGLLDMAPGTRTSIEELQKIAAIGGQMAVPNAELLTFVDTIDKFNVALGSDFAGGTEEATKALAGLKNLFKETRALDISASITKAGSAINSLSSQGVNVPELTEFMSRIGQLPDAIKPTIQEVAALGSVLNKVGISAEIGSRAVGDILLTGAQNLPKFAKQMGISEKAAKQLINSNPAEFLNKFAASLKGMDATSIARVLKGLKLTDAGAIKVVGALSTNIDQVTKFQKIANEEFAKGTSLLDEYNTKNETTAAKIKKAKNSLEAFSIILGQELLPILNKVLMKVLPILKAMITWAKENPKTVKTIVGLTLAIAALSFIVSGVSSAIFLYSQIMLLASHWTKVVTAAQWLWNAAMAANPIGLIIIGIAAMIALIVVVVKKWDEWGAAASLFLYTILGPLNILIQVVMSFMKHWEMVKNSFMDGGFIAGIKAIGAVIVDAIIYPIRQLIGLIAQFTGSEMLANAVSGIDKFRASLGLDTETINPKAAEQDGLVSRMEKTERQKVDININDKTGRASMEGGTPLIPVRLTSTAGF